MCVLRVAEPPEECDGASGAAAGAAVADELHVSARLAAQRPRHTVALAELCCTQRRERFLDLTHCTVQYMCSLFGHIL